MTTVRARRLRGFTYLGLLFAIALLGVALAATGVSWRQAALREQERESIFRGQQIADALGRWRAAGGESPAGPQALQDLLEDRRDGLVRRHLRRLWDDPLTGRPDWVLLRDARGAIVALASRSARPAVLTDGLKASVPGQAPKVSDRVFRPQAAAVQAAAVAP